ncbi:vitamin B12-dependent ribonucleotide reductase [Candidatus Woesearchaeota archaeon]|nr:vitamin B12-dependent ribonucleotide reductase [Candidatus Woesearchaeota archaeon]
MANHTETIPLETLVEPQLTKNSRIVLEKRYLQKDENLNVIETPKQLFWRVAYNIASADKLYNPNANVIETAKRFYNMMAKLKFLPNSPTLMNAGADLQQLSGCFVLPVGDSMEEIFDTIKNTALVHKSGGGTGFSFSRLRPKNDVVKSTGGVASGPISFMKVFNSATEEVKQGGTRRGANMGILNISHPNIIEFIKCKEEEGILNNFNISVAVTDKFMRAVENNEEFELINPKTKKVVKKINAKETFNLIVDKAWSNGEPGVVFIDILNKSNPTPELGEIESTNPCGEQPLLPYESCNLGSINLSKFVENNTVNWAKLKDITWLATHFLDNVIDVNSFPLPEIEKTTKANRKIGLGVMGFADMLIQLKIPYTSEKALELGEKIMAFIDKESKAASMKLAEQRGAFPNFNKSIYKNGPKIRNATRTTIAPTGTIGVIAGASGGIEPLFAVAYTRHVKDSLGADLVEINPYFEKALKEKGVYSNELISKVVKSNSIQKIKELPEDIRKIFVTAHDVTPKQHIRMQAAFQKHTDNAVSKTVNFPNKATREDVKNVYLLAYKLNCKGVTVYRDGSRQVQVLKTKKEDEKKTEKNKSKVLPKPKERPEMITGVTYKIRTGYGSLYVTINSDDKGEPFEVFAQTGKTGGVLAAKSEAICRMVSLALRSGIDIDEVIEQLKGIRGPMPHWSKKGIVLSIPDAISKILSAHINKGQTALTEFNGNEQEKKLISSGEPKSIADTGMLPECPDCSNILEFKEGCVVCQFCGYSRCN